MHTLVQLQKPTPKIKSGGATSRNRDFTGQSPDGNYILQLQRTKGNQAVLRTLRSSAEERSAELTRTTSQHDKLDSDRLSLHPASALSHPAKIDGAEPEYQIEGGYKFALEEGEELAQLAEPGKTMGAPRVGGRSAGARRRRLPFPSSWLTGQVTIGTTKYLLRGPQFYNEKGEAIPGMEILPDSYREVANAVYKRRRQLPASIWYRVHTGKGGIRDLSQTASDGMFKAKRYAYGRSWWVWILQGGKWLHLIPRFRRKPVAFKGYAMTGGGSARTVLKRYKNNIHMRNVGLTDELIEIIAGITAVETEGQISAVNTWDNMGISVGFAQATYRCGNLYNLYSIYAPAKKKFIAAGISFTNEKKLQIDGQTQTYHDLDKPEVVYRFFKVSLEPEVLAAQVKWFKQERLTPAMKPANARRLPQLKNPAVKALLAEYYNNTPAWYYMILRGIRVARGITAKALFDLIAEKAREVLKSKQGNYGLRKARGIRSRIYKAMKHFL